MSGNITEARVSEELSKFGYTLCGYNEDGLRVNVAASNGVTKRAVMIEEPTLEEICACIQEAFERAR